MSATSAEIAEMEELHKLAELHGHKVGGAWWKRKAKDITERHSHAAAVVKKEKKGARARFDWEADFEQQHGSLQDAAAFKSFDAVFPEMKNWRNDVPRSGHANVKGLRGCNFRRCRAEDEDGEAVRARVVELGGGNYLYQLGRSVQPGGEDDDEGGDDDDDDDKKVDVAEVAASLAQVGDGEAAAAAAAAAGGPAAKKAAKKVAAAVPKPAASGKAVEKATAGKAAAAKTKAAAAGTSGGSKRPEAAAPPPAAADGKRPRRGVNA